MLSASGVTLNPSSIVANNGKSTFTMPAKNVNITANVQVAYKITVISVGDKDDESIEPSSTIVAKDEVGTITAKNLKDYRKVLITSPGITFSPEELTKTANTATIKISAKNIAITAFYSNTPVKHADKGVDFNMNFVPSGKTFIMGEHNSDANATDHNVTLTNDFYMGETEVTQELWEKVYGVWPGFDPTEKYGLGDYYPAYNINWYKAVAFCNELTKADTKIQNNQIVYYSDSALNTAYTKINAKNQKQVYVDWTKKGYRLPTEAEWEYAARYKDGNTWTPGDHLVGDESASASTTSVGSEYMWFSSDGETSHIVGTKKPSALGIFNMNGNVAEWCYDWYDNYTATAVTDPVGPNEGTYKSCRGSSYMNSINDAPCSSRGATYTHRRINSIGFRICRFK